MAPPAPIGITSEQCWEQVPDLMLPWDLQYHGPCSILGLEDAHFPRLCTPIPRTRHHANQDQHGALAAITALPMPISGH